MDEVKYLLIGGGVASVHAGAAIRKHDPEGTIMLVGAEPNPPTDRPPLSKQFLLDDSWTREDPESKPRDFYPANRIDLRTGLRAIGLDRARRTVALSDGSEVQYESLLLATGASARRLPISGADLDGVMTLRSIDDAANLRDRLTPGRKAVVVGSGFIGLEVAAGCVARGAQAIVIDPADRPHSLLAAPEFGNYLEGLYRQNGVDFFFGDSAASFERAGDKLVVSTQQGRRFEADVVVVGVGAKLNTELAAGAQLRLDSKGAVLVDSSLRTSDPAIWVAGDIASFDDVALGKRWHIEHFLNAKWQGAVAGANMVGAAKIYDRVAYFYSDILDIHINLRGDAEEMRLVQTLGDTDAGEFVQLYSDGDGALRKTLAVSHDEVHLEKTSDGAERLIREKAEAQGLTAADFET